MKRENFVNFSTKKRLEDRVIRRIALRRLASEGVAVGRTDLVPEVTITAEGVYWHPVGAEDNDLLVMREIFLYSSRSPPCAALLIANASTPISWLGSLTAHEYCSCGTTSTATGCHPQF